MKILLLGKNGQLGSDIFDFLQYNEFCLENLGFTRDELDVTDFAKLEHCLSALDFDILINCKVFTKLMILKKIQTQPFL